MASRAGSTSADRSRRGKAPLPTTPHRVRRAPGRVRAHGGRLTLAVLVVVAVVARLLGEVTGVGLAAGLAADRSFELLLLGEGGVLAGEPRRLPGRVVRLRTGLQGHGHGWRRFQGQRELL